MKVKLTLSRQSDIRLRFFFLVVAAGPSLLGYPLSNPPFQDPEIIDLTQGMEDDGVPDWWVQLNNLGSGDLRLHDSDEDGLSDAEEYFLTVENLPEFTGTLRWETLLSMLERSGRILDPNNFDTDGDGYSDGYEVGQGSDPFSPKSTPSDSDLDGFTDGEELQAGFDPNDPISYPDYPIFSLDMSNEFTGSGGERLLPDPDQPFPTLVQGLSGDGANGGLRYWTFGNVSLREMTIHFWYKPDVSSGGRSDVDEATWSNIFSLGYPLVKYSPPHLGLYLHRDNQILRLSYADGSGAEGGDIGGGSWVHAYGDVRLKADAWTHFTITYDGTTCRLYQNGIEIIDAALPGPFRDYPDKMRFIALEDRAIDEIVIWNHVRSESEIETVAQVDSDGDNLYDYWEYSSFGSTAVEDSVSGDPDEDGIENEEEMIAGTDGGSPDSDDDGLADGVETGFSDALIADSDKDGLSDVDESIANTNPFSVDTDGDLLPDGFETYLNLDPLTTDVLSLVDSIDVSQPAQEIGRWKWLPGPDRLRLFEPRGKLHYDFEVPTAGLYAIRFQIHQTAGSYSRDRADSAEIYDTYLSVNGRQLGSVSFNQSLGNRDEAWVLTPFLSAGTHSLAIFFAEIPRFISDYSVEQISVFQIEGIDADSSGVPDWEETFSAHWYAFLNTPSESWVSPTVIEGLARFPESASSVDADVRPGLRSHWFAPVDLDPSGNPKEVNLSFENGEVEISTSVAWKPRNILEDENGATLFICEGDTIRITAIDSDQSQPPGTFEILVDGINHLGVVGSFVELSFPSPGLYSLSGVHGNASVSLNLRVGQSPFPVEGFPLQVREQRDFSVPGIVSSGLQLEFDSELLVADLGAGLHRIETRFPEDYSVIARVGTDGPIIGRRSLQGFTLDYTNESYLLILSSEGGVDTVQAELFGLNLPSTVRIFMDIFAPDVSFHPDQATMRSVYSSSFDDLGIYTYEMSRPSDVEYSTCHTTEIFDEGSGGQSMGLLTN